MSEELKKYRNQLTCEHEWGEPKWAPDMFDGESYWFCTCNKCGLKLKMLSPELPEKEGKTKE